MKTLQCLVLMSSLVAVSSFVPSVAQDVKPAHSADAPHGVVADFGSVAVGGYTIGVTSEQAPTPGASICFDIALPAGQPPPRAVRLWVGTEDAAQTGKTLMEIGSKMTGHGHADIPDPMAADYRLWVEVEDATKKKSRGSIAMKVGGAKAHDHDAHEGHDHAGHAHDHEGHEHASMVTATVAGTAGRYTLTLTDKAGAALGADQLLDNHGALVHLFAIDGSLTDYTHTHPTPATDGTWAFDFAPKNGGTYTVFAEITPASTAEREVASTTITLPGEGKPVARVTTNTVTVDGHRFTATWEEEKFSAGHPHKLSVAVVGPGGAAVALEPYLGAYAHIVAFNEDGTELAHVHPVGTQPATEADRGASPVEAMVDFDEGGYKALFVQVKIGGRVMTAPFGVEVGEAKAPAAKADDHDHTGHDHK